MATILLTRPHAASEQLAQTLKQLGYDTAIEPLLSIMPTKASLPDISDIKIVMITSANALAVLQTDQVTKLLGLPCYCVGNTTAHQARTFGFKDVRDAAGDGVALAQLIRKQVGPSRSILHIAGRDVARGAHDLLQQAGFSIAAWPVYAAEPVTALSDSTISMLKDGKLHAVLVFSPGTAEALKALLVRHALEACCANLIGLGISAAAVASLKTLPWRRLDIAAEPTEEAVTRRLQTLLPVSGP